MRRSGFTMIEVMVAMTVFVIAIVALMGVYLGIAALSESSRNLTQAMADARVVLEGLRDTSGGGLAAVTGTDWTAWAENNGLTSLRDEAVTVTYADPAADPLSVTIQVTWEERQRARAATLNTLVTRR
jgi:prepilin-type N-terminal cleavage/methylation domain-containing protein